MRKRFQTNLAPCCSSNREHFLFLTLTLLVKGGLAKDQTFTVFENDPPPARKKLKIHPNLRAQASLREAILNNVEDF